MQIESSLSNVLFDYPRPAWYFSTSNKVSNIISRLMDNKKCRSVVLQCSDGLSNKVSYIIRRLMDNMKCSSVVLQCSDGLSNKVSNIISRLMDNMKCSSVVMVLVIRCQTLLEDLWTIWSCCLYVLYKYYSHIPSYSLCLTTLTEVFSCFFLSRKANARVKPAKTGHGPHSS